MDRCGAREVRRATVPRDVGCHAAVCLRLLHPPRRPCDVTRGVPSEWAAGAGGEHEKARLDHCVARVKITHTVARSGD